MKDDSDCCRNLAVSDKSPFEVSMLGWYDGLTSGLAKCRICDRTYHFELIAQDAEGEVRLYGFKEVSHSCYDAIVGLLVGPVPPAEQAREFGDQVMLRVRDALATNLERKLFVASTDLTKVILSAQIVDFDRWESILGLQ